MDFLNSEFIRLFSINYSKRLKIKLGEMSFASSFTDEVRGNPYPIISKDPNSNESVYSGKYTLVNNSANPVTVVRLLGKFFSYSDYEIGFKCIEGKIGIKLISNDDKGCGVTVFIENVSGKYKIGISAFNETKYFDNINNDFHDGVSFTFTGNHVDIYSVDGLIKTFSCSFDFSDWLKVTDISHIVYACIFNEVAAEGMNIIENIEWNLDNGVALADIKPIKNVYGEPLIIDGKIYITMTSRTQSSGYQSVISWLPGTAEFKLEGAIFFDHGDHILCSDVASSVVYDDESGEYLLWMCSFSHGHILGFGKTDCDILHGINIVNITNMKVKTNSNELEFFGISGDEDPDFYYDSSTGKWNLTICRPRNIDGNRTYSYVKFISDEPFYGYEYDSSTDNKSETGGLFTKISNSMYFVCGANFEAESCYRIYDKNLKFITEASFDFPDGGFRGWGTIIPIKCGNKEKLYWITFDRKLFGDNNWSYGNLYVFEM